MNDNNKRLLIINPNSSDFITEGIRKSVAPVQAMAGHRIECVGLRDAPAGIDTQADVDTVIPLIAACIEGSDYDAYVLACFSDPGIRELRRGCDRPVFGIGECAYLQAMAMGERFGVISTLAEAAARHRRYLSELGFTHRLAADLPLDLGAAELADEQLTYRRIAEVAEALVANGADVIILGCAGMSHYGDKLRGTFGKPVIEPTVAAVQHALSSLYFV